MSQGRGNITWIANIDGIDGLGREYYLLKSFAVAWQITQF